MFQPALGGMVGPQVHMVGPQVHMVGPQVHMVGPQMHMVGPQVHMVGPQVLNLLQKWNADRDAFSKQRQETHTTLPMASGCFLLKRTGMPGASQHSHHALHFEATAGRTLQ